MLKSPLKRKEYYFDAYGPFEIQLDDNRQVLSRGKQERLWNKVREYEEEYEYAEDELRNSFGVYVFGMEYGETLTPWYVGMTIAKAGFWGEIFQRHKLKKYNEVTQKDKRAGTPIMFLFPLLEEKLGELSWAKRRNRTLISWVEKMIMGLARIMHHI